MRTEYPGVSTEYSEDLQLRGYPLFGAENADRRLLSGNVFVFSRMLSYGTDRGQLPLTGN